MSYPGDPKRIRRAPGAEHPVRVRKLGVNPLRLAGLTAAQVAQVLGAVSARAIQRTIVEHPPEETVAGVVPEDRHR